MFFIGFYILSYLIRPHATTSIGYIKLYAKPSQSNVLSSYTQMTISYMGQTRYPSKRQHSQQELCLQYKVCWILYRMVDVPSFSQPYLCIQRLLQSPPKILFSPSVNFYLPILPYLVHKIILTILTNTLFLST